MKRIPITIATADYDRVRPLIDGRVQIEGCEVTYIPLQPYECFYRAYVHQEFEVSEIGFSPFLIALSRRINPYVAVPVFLSRRFRHSSIYIRNDRGIDRPEDLKGKIAGVPEYQMSAAMWARGMLEDDYGVRPDNLQWRQGGLEQWGRQDKFELNLPDGFPLEAVPEKSTLSQMLADGEIDVLFSAREPSCFRNGHPEVGRLFEDYASIEKDYYQRTGVFPIMHALGIRRDMVERYSWLPFSVYKAFVEAKRIADQDFDSVDGVLKIGLPWLSEMVAETRAIMGNNFWAYGAAENRITLETMARYSYDQGLATRRLAIEEMFAPATVETARL